ncbi:SRPBCC family protein [Winogradskyella eckloniae]|uniref:SRPBCC family protein n=1 Tax=Winogradskyella eckloniae TaxID=1089306 RepID=UPI001566066B|nr:SRPBCC family protein [Winogradskyella eckloniae]NRD20176.1 SRPBCC family protein [Winogradskyella eckloniae]
MPTIEIKTLIKADIKTCFDLARNIDFHKASMTHSKERAIAGKTSGLIALGESVTWEAKHFGIRQQLTSKITAFESPTYFVDEMVSGAFKSFKHEHIFSTQEDKTLMVDVFQFQSPFGILGKLANGLFLTRYMTNLLTQRNQYLKSIAES